MTFTQARIGNVTIWQEEEEIAYYKDKSGKVQALQDYAEDYIANRLAPILTKEELQTISYTIRFGMHPINS